jgi:hypothetical protein
MKMENPIFCRSGEVRNPVFKWLDTGFRRCDENIEALLC